MKPIYESASESREAYIKKAARWGRRRFNYLQSHDYAWPHSQHESHTVAQVLRECEKQYPDLESFGEEGDCEENGEGHITIQYLNMGDTYALTIVYWRGRFMVTSWGDIVESLPESEAESC